MRRVEIRASTAHMSMKWSEERAGRPSPHCSFPHLFLVPTPLLSFPFPLLFSSPLLSSSSLPSLYPNNLAITRGASPPYKATSTLLPSHHAPSSSPAAPANKSPATATVAARTKRTEPSSDFSAGSLEAAAATLASSTIAKCPYIPLTSSLPPSTK